MASGQYAEARGVLQREIRQAQAQRRHRRALKLLTLLALGQFAQGNQSMAFRTMLRALEIAAPQGFVRSLLDEGPQLTRLLRALREAQPALPAGVQPDPVQQHLDHLLALSGDGPADAASPKPEQTTQAAPLVEQLTRRELDILRQVSRGLSNREMADRLCVSTNTVKWHMRNIFEKLQTRNRVQAIAAARNLGLID
jgi:LuxR family maltose regulon positive regulatory protein